MSSVSKSASASAKPLAPGKLPRPGGTRPLADRQPMVTRSTDTGRVPRTPQALMPEAPSTAFEDTELRPFLGNVQDHIDSIGGSLLRLEYQLQVLASRISPIISQADMVEQAKGNGTEPALPQYTSLSDRLASIDSSVGNLIRVTADLALRVAI